MYSKRRRVPTSGDARASVGRLMDGGVNEFGRSNRGFQFHLRGLLSLVTVVAVLCAFWARLYVAPRRAEMQARRAQTQAMDVMRKLDGHVLQVGWHANDRRPAVILRRATDDDLALIGELEYFQRNLQGICLQGCAVTDDGIAHLKAVRQLEFANLVDTYVTGEGIEEFQTKHPTASIVHGSANAQKWSLGEEAAKRRERVNAVLSAVHPQLSTGRSVPPLRSGIAAPASDAGM